MAATTAPQLRRALKRSAPGLSRERALWEAGHEVVVGIDEVGRGAWAGPLTIGAVVLPRDRRVNKVRDSKQLTEREREALFDRITDWCVAWSVGHASERECDELGVSDAQRLAARRAIDGLGVAQTQGDRADHGVGERLRLFLEEGQAHFNLRLTFQNRDRFVPAGWVTAGAAVKLLFRAGFAHFLKHRVDGFSAYSYRSSAQKTKRAGDVGRGSINGITPIARVGIHP